MNRYWVTRTVIESIEVEAEDEDRADILAAETPIDEWRRDIKDETCEVILP